MFHYYRLTFALYFCCCLLVTTIELTFYYSEKWLRVQLNLYVSTFNIRFIANRFIKCNDLNILRLFCITTINISSISFIYRFNFSLNCCSTFLFLVFFHCIYSINIFIICELHIFYFFSLSGNVFHSFILWSGNTQQLQSFFCSL